jgi:uncharacterized protein (DUF362 family)/NAD-dependent dihydropyrimidine dehydrogenase PreA subunit
MHTVSITRCTSYDRAEVKPALQRAIDLAGGLSHFVKKNSIVLIKPNLLRNASRDTCVVTDPEIIRALVEILETAEPSRIMIGDSPAQGSIQPILRKSGYIDILGDKNIFFTELDDPVEIKGLIFPKLVVSGKVLSADTVINVAKAKTHAQTGLTLAVKNCFGTIPGLRKAQWHVRTGRDTERFCQMLLDIYLAVNPALNIIDAVIGMEGNGPGNGKPRRINAILASGDGIAIDTVMADILGYPLKYLPLHQAALKLKKAPDSADEIQITGDPISEFMLRDFKKAIPTDLRMLPPFAYRMLRNIATPKPYVKKILCKKCGKCEEICLAKAITMVENNPPVIDRSKCIHCFCCQEICPYGAIVVRSGTISNLLVKNKTSKPHDEE